MYENAGKNRQYLLGNLPEDESEKLDLRIISGENSADELTKAEEDLMEEYLDGELSEAELELFKRNFLISEERTDRLKQISLLRNYAQKKADQNIIKVENAVEPEGFFQKLITVFAPNQRPSTAIFGILIIVLTGILLWQTFFQNPANRADLWQGQIIALNEQDLSNLEDYKDLTNLSLAAGTMRDSSQNNSISAENLTGQILIRLAVPSDLVNENAFDAKISANEKDVMTIGEIRPYDNKSGKEFRLLLPKSLLNKGEYKIEILPENTKAMPAKYSFIVK